MIDYHFSWENMTTTPLLRVAAWDLQVACELVSWMCVETVQPATPTALARNAQRNTLHGTRSVALLALLSQLYAPHFFNFIK